jgi:hypothetical protein
VALGKIGCLALKIDVTRAINEFTSDGAYFRVAFWLWGICGEVHECMRKFSTGAEGTESFLNVYF